jgi:hypothetical protein
MADAPDFTFRDAGLHSRLLRGANRIAGAFGGSVRKRLSFAPDALLAAARRKTGLADFGEDTLREPLEVLQTSVEHEAKLTPFGRLAFHGLLLGALTNRLQLLDWVKQHPEVKQERIERPWIVIGLPRTGTTLLSILLGLDPLARPLEQWEASQPVPPPDLATYREDPRIAECARTFERLQTLNPPIRAMHPFGATLATECVTLLIFDLRSLSLETQAFVPSYGAWLEQTDMRHAYALHERALQLLQSKLPTHAWSLKTPQHLWSLEAMLERYPDARVIWTHRDPTKVVPSVASLNTAMQRMTSDDVDPVRVGGAWNEKLHLAVSRGVEFDRRTQTGWCHHLLYEDLMRDPIEAMRKLYAHFGDDVHPHHERLLRAWLEERPQQAFGRHRYDARDFGLEPGAIAERYREYTSRFGVPAEG